MEFWQRMAAAVHAPVHQLGPRRPYPGRRDALARRPFTVEMLAIRQRRATGWLAVDDFAAAGPQAHFLTQHPAHELAMAHVADGLRNVAAQHLRRVPTGVLLEQVGDEADVPQLVVEETLPDRPHAAIGLR